MLLWMKRVMVWVFPRMAPETTNTAPNSPNTRAVVKVTPYASPRRMLGRVMRRNTVKVDAPSVAAACS